MKRFARLVLLGVSLCGLILAGCEDSPTATTQDRPTLLTAKTWKTTAFTLNGQDAIVIAPVSVTFQSNGTYMETNFGGSSSNGTWEFNVDDTSLKIIESGDTVNWDVVALTSTSFKLHASEVISGGPWVSDWSGIPQ